MDQYDFTPDEREALAAVPPKAGLCARWSGVSGHIGLPGLGGTAASDAGVTAPATLTTVPAVKA